MTATTALLLDRLHRAGLDDVVAVEPAAGGLAATAGIATRSDGTSVFVKVFGEPVVGEVARPAAAHDDATGDRTGARTGDLPFVAEADGLAALRGLGGVATPDVVVADRELLALSVLRPRPGSAAFWERLAHELARMHTSTVHPRFGWAHDNWLGRRRQDNTWEDDGFVFFARHRLLRWVDEPRVEAVLDAADRAALERLCERLPELLPDRPACLVHGDLWTGNVLATADGRPALIDPAVSYAWAEIDLAHLWTTAPPPEAGRFFDVYAELTGLDPAWRERVPLIQLRQHLAVLSQYDDVWGAADQVRGTLAPFRRRS